jgi:hypothetical protein
MALTLRVAGQLALLFAALLATLWSWGSLLHMAGAFEYLGYILRDREPMDMWAVLDTVEIAATLTSFVGMAVMAWRKKALGVLAFFLVQIPTPMVIEGSRCDTGPSCALLGWAAVPNMYLLRDTSLYP